jgi:hypothetical protein
MAEKTKKSNTKSKAPSKSKKASTTKKAVSSSKKKEVTTKHPVTKSKDTQIDLKINLASDFLVLVFVIIIAILSGVIGYFIGSTTTDSNVVPSIANQNLPSQPSESELDQIVNDNFPPVTERDYILGNTNARYVLVEYSDLDCPYCKQFHDTMNSFISNTSLDIAWVYRHFPLTSHPEADDKAEYLECIGNRYGNQAFWDASNVLFEDSYSLNRINESLSKLPQVNIEEITACVNSGEFTEYVKESLQKAHIWCLFT